MSCLRLWLWYFVGWEGFSIYSHSVGWPIFVETEATASRLICSVCYGLSGFEGLVSTINNAYDGKSLNYNAVYSHCSILFVLFFLSSCICSCYEHARGSSRHIRNNDSGYLYSDNSVLWGTDGSSADNLSYETAIIRWSKRFWDATNDSHHRRQTRQQSQGYHGTTPLLIGTSHTTKCLCRRQKDLEAVRSRFPNAIFRWADGSI